MHLNPFGLLGGDLSGTLPNPLLSDPAGLAIAGQVFGRRSQTAFAPNGESEVLDMRVLLPHLQHIPEVRAGSNVTVTRDALGYTVAASSGGGGSFFTGTADFGTASPTPDSVTVSIADAGVLAGSIIVTGIRVPSSRDADEMELGPVQCSIGAVTGGVGFDIIVTATDGTADGQYTVNATRN